MASAYKCDRCGKYHELKEGRDVVEVKRYNSVSLLACDSYEICLDCRDELIKFMEVKEDEYSGK